MFRFTMINHLCHDMETVMDTTRPTDRIRQDVARSPGGDSRMFLNNCVGCHSGMDPMAQAFAYYNFDGSDHTGTHGVHRRPGAAEVLHQLHELPVRASSRRTTAGRTAGAQGPNALLGWDPSAARQRQRRQVARPGARQSSDAFAQCQVQKVFQAVCFRAPTAPPTRRRSRSSTNSFKNGGYKLKQVVPADRCRLRGPVRERLP